LEERMRRLIAALEAWDGVAEQGLPPELFELVSELIRLVNVDLLIRDQQLGTLLAWRQDERLWSGLAHPRRHRPL
jgi:hypothetical protein